MKSHLKLLAPGNENRKVTPTRVPNADLRTREYLTPAEIDKLIEASKASRYPQRDRTLTLVVYRHGLRAVEACDLVSGRFQDRHAVRPARQEWQTGVEINLNYSFAQLPSAAKPSSCCRNCSVSMSVGMKARQPAMTQICPELDAQPHQPLLAPQIERATFCESLSGMLITK